jgi:hypothetical protein
MGTSPAGGQYDGFLLDILDNSRRLTPVTANALVTLCRFWDHELAKLRSFRFSVKEIVITA